MSLGLNDEKSKAKYEKINHLKEKVSKIVYFAVFGVSVPSFVIPKTISSYFEYYAINQAGDAFDFSMPLWYVLKHKWDFHIFFGTNPKLNCFSSFQRFPFSWHNPIGYLIAVILESIALSHSICYLASLMSLAFGAFIFAILLLEEMKGILKSIQKRSKSKRKHPQLMTRFVKFHDLLTDGEQLSNLKFIPHFRIQKYFHDELTFSTHQIKTNRWT